MTGSNGALSEYQIRERAQGAALAKELFKGLNTLSGEHEIIKGFVDEVFQTHRTLQQAFGRLLLGVIREGANSKGRDLRNEAFIAYCEEVEAKFSGTHFPLV